MSALGGLRTLHLAAIDLGMLPKPLLVLPLVCLASCQDVSAFAEQCPAPLGHWRKQSEGMNHHAIPVHVRLDASGAAKWNGENVTDSKLAAYLETSRQMNPLPFVILSAEAETRCNRVQTVRKLMDRRYCHVRWACGEGSGKSRDWNQVMDLPPPKELRRLGKQADAAREASESCATPSDVEPIEGTDGTAPSHYRCRPIRPK